MKYLLVVISWFLLLGVAAAQSPPNGTPCNALGSGGAVTLCKPGWSYGCSASQTSNQIVSTDGNRTGWQFQNTGTIPIVMCFGDACVGSNGFVVQPGNSYLWSNIGRGNEPGRVASPAVSIIATGISPCTFMFTD